MVGSRARTARREYTIDDLDQLWTGEKRYEVTDGELDELTPPGFGHGRIEGRLFRLLSEHVERHGLGDVVGETMFRLDASGRTGRAADVAFVRKERLPPDRDGLRAFHGPPDLAVAVVSPTDRPDDLQRKVQDYLVAGAGGVLLVYFTIRRLVLWLPGGQTVTVAPGGELDLDAIVPGLRLRADAVFGPPPARPTRRRRRAT
jgi:Uma2 family endonuclease